MNYYFGQEHPNATPVLTCGPVPVQPGLCFQQISPAPDGKLHIFDSYVTWQTTPKLTLQLEGDYVIQRLWANAGTRSILSSSCTPTAAPDGLSISSRRGRTSPVAESTSPTAAGSSAE